jgi:thiol-disulfide isomerase/thioredoxin
MNDKIIALKDYKKHSKFNKNRKMFFLLIVFATAVGLISWHFFVENVENSEVAIPASRNIDYSQEMPKAMSAAQIANKFENAHGKPILLYIYTTWCKTCFKTFPVINEIAREFQNTELEIITLAIDRDMTDFQLKNHLQKYGQIYFEPQFLAFKDGFISLLQNKGISYNGRIPFTVLISRGGEVVVKFSGSKSKNYLRNRIIKELY